MFARRGTHGVSMKSALLWLPAVALGFAGVSAAAPNPRLDVWMDERILDLEEGFDLTIWGQDVDPPPFAMEIVVAGVDVTSAVTVDETFEFASEAEPDGSVKVVSIRFSVSWDELDPAVGDLVTVTITAPHAGGSVRRSVSARVVSHVAVFLEAPEAGTGPIVEVAVKVDEAEILSRRVTVELNDVDVTSRVRIAGPRGAHDVHFAVDWSVTQYRLEGFVVDFQSTELHSDDRLRVTVEVTTPRGITMSSAVVSVIAASD